MTSERGAGGEPDDLELPPVQMADLDEATVRALFADVELLCERVSVTLKHAAERYVTEGATPVGEALAALLAGHALGVQLRYEHDGHGYLDTVMRGPSGYRLVRVQSVG